MTMIGIPKILALVAALGMAAPVWAGQYDAVFGDVQRMVGQAA